MSIGLNFSRRIRRTAYTNKVEQAGVSGFSVVNHMLLPKAFKHSVEDDYWHLRKDVQLWDVSTQRVIEVVGPDASKLIQLMTPRNISICKAGDCLYLPIIDQNAGLINDPVLLKHSEEKFWLSIADSDLLLFAIGLSIGLKLDVVVSEADIWTVSIQGPKAEDLISDLFGEQTRNIKFFKFDKIDFKKTKQIIARSGYSRQGGFEIYLEGKFLGPDLWDLILQAGQRYNIRPGSPNIIERVEGGLFSYGNEITRENNPFEMGLGKYCSLNGEVDYVGREALQKIAAEGVSQKLKAFVFDGSKCPVCSSPWLLTLNGKRVGQITSAMYSPRKKANVSIAMIKREYWSCSDKITVDCMDGELRDGRIDTFPII